MGSKELFLKLLRVETEKEISQIIKKEGMDNPRDWQPYGDQASNWSIIGNQSSSAERALVEKITNSVDALLMRKCLELGIDPRGSSTPKNPQEALVEFFNIEGGKSCNITKQIEEKISKDLCLIATSQDMKPIKELGRNAHINLTIYDAGEGQTPNKLPKTILSLLSGNKQGIPFTQGNYNQGGSGALMFCGKENYCLVVSKRCPKINDKFIDKNDDSIFQWGWTLIRLELREDTRDPMFTYYAPNKKVPRFVSNTLPLRPRLINGEEAKKYLDYDKSCSAGLPYEEEVEFGTAIKMYNYNLKQKGPLVSHFKYELSRCILDTYLPFSVIDCRKNKFNNHSSFRGYNKLIEDDLQEKNEEKRLINDRFPIVTNFKIDNQLVKLTTYGLNSRKGGTKNEKSFIGESSPIRFVLGQQFQGEVNRTIISSSGLGVLKDSLLLLVEFPDLDPVFKKDLFMTDRERLLDKKPKKEIINYIKTFLSQDEILREFASEKMKNMIEEQTGDDPNVKNTLEKWLEKNPEIQSALGFGSWFPNSQNGENGGEGEGKAKKPKKGGICVPLPEDPVVTNYIPTYFTPICRINEAEQEYFTTATKGKKFTVRFKTDAQDDFFDRLSEKGAVTIRLDGIETDKFTYTLKNGKASFSFTDKISNKIGEYKINFEINCNSEELFNCSVLLIVVEEKETKTNPEDDSQNESFSGLPSFKVIFEEEWPDEMNERTGASVIMLGKDINYLINGDNVHLLNKLETLASEGEKEFYRKLFTFAMLFSAMATKNYEEEKRKGKPDYSWDLTVEEVIANSTENVSRTFFVMEELSAKLRSSVAMEI